MKKSIFTLFAIALVAFGISSCQKEEAATTPQMIKHFRAGIENSTKTTLNSELYTEWVAGDQIRLSILYSGEVTVAGTFTAAPDPNDPTWADFENDEEYEIVGDIHGGPAGAQPYYAVYPASIAQGQRADRVCLPAVQNSTDGSFAGAPMVADFRNLDPEGDALPRVKFQNLCGVMKIHLQQAGTYISEIAVIADQQLRGTYTISYTDGIPALTAVSQSDANHITLALDGAQDIGNDGKDFYIYLPAGNYTNMKLRIKNSAGNYCVKTCTAVTINRNEIVPITIGGTMTFSEATAYLMNKAFGGIASLRTITSVTFHYNCDMTGITGPDISANGDGSIIQVIEGTAVDIYTSAAIIQAPVSCVDLFRNKSALQSINFGEGFRTDNVTDMTQMFFNCDALTSLDLSFFNTANVTTMYRMFSTCSNLRVLDLSNFNTAAVTNMEQMFRVCISLESLDLSSFSSRENLSVDRMFQGCNKLASIEFNQNFTSSNTNYTCSILGTDVPDGCTIHCNSNFANLLQNGGGFYPTKVHFNTTY